MMGGAAPTGATLAKSRPDMPLGYFYAANRRQRRFCAELTAATQAPDVLAPALKALAIDLAEDFQRLEGAEKLLFKLLRRRAEPEDDFSRILGILASDHDTDRALHLELGAALCAYVESTADRVTLATLVERFVARKLRTIALENAVVLPIARLRLKPADLRQLAANLGRQPCLPSVTLTDDAVPTFEGEN